MAAAFDFSSPPFDRLSAPELERFEARVDVAFFRRGEVIVRAGEVPPSFYILIKGSVRELDGPELVAAHGPGDCFDSSLLVERKCRHTFVVDEEAICYLLPLDELLELTANNKAFAEFFYRDLSLKLDALAARQTIRDLQPLMTARVRDAYMHPPVFLDGSTSAFDAANLMKETRTTSLLVRDGERVGIATGYDLRDGIILERRPLETPIGGMATYQLVTIDADDLLIEALLSLTRHGVRRLVVVDRGEIVGVLEQLDLLSFLSSQSHIVIVEISRAQTLDDLRQASARLVDLVQVLHGHGTKIPYITQLVAELTRRIIARAFSILAPDDAFSADSCLIVMGSEGRGDQILRTDQDNGLILRDGAVLPGLEELCDALTAALISFGYPRCPGNVMVSNPAWRGPLRAWRDDLRRWVREPDEQALMNVAIFYDAAPVAGDAKLLAAAKAHLLELSAGNSAFCARFARAIDSFDTPLGFFGNLLAGRSALRNELDVKKGGIFPVVHGVRALALEQRLGETNTAERIRRLQEANVLDGGFARDLTEAYGFLLGLRLQTRLHKLRLEQPLDNLVRPGELNKFERDLLKDSLVIVNRFKDLVRNHFPLSVL